MTIEFERALKERCTGDARCELLYAQWSYDKLLVSRALQSVGRWFPHYSLHDASHSDAILTHIARLLGEDRVARLSATDLWLLLEAAYYHDLGMVITDDDARDWWTSDEFREHLGKLARGDDRELRGPAGKLLDKTELPRSHRLWPLELVRDVTLVLADYGRVQHAHRAARIATQPGHIGLESPRVDGLIPRRLFGMLSRICAHHGRDFEDTMALPRRENGLGTDEAHPRFVAVMLRLGDLLDLDNGRFCPVMTRSIGHLPPSSVAHERKHAAIQHFHVGPDRIEVDAECDDYAPYEALDYWLGMLRDELSNLAVRWNDVAPMLDFGGPPNMGRIDARLKGHWTPEPGKRPKFKIDRDAFLDFSRGTNLYSNRFECIRELLQNAVDASLLRLWCELDDKSETEDHKDPIAWLHERLETYPIDVTLERVESDRSDGPDDPDNLLYRFTIRDHGTGISKPDLEYLQKIGSSLKNPARRRMIEQMPEWMRPSGIFGIGLQSVFLLTNKLEIQTLHHETRERLKITLQSGTGGHADGLYISELPHDAEPRKPGTIVSFEFEALRVPGRVWLTAGQAQRILARYDFISDSFLEYDKARISDQIERYAATSLCRVRLNGEIINAEGSTDVVWFYDDESSVRMGFYRGDCTMPQQTQKTIKTSYRGAPLETREQIFPILENVCIDIYFGSAKELLSLNREKLSVRGIRSINDILRGTIGRIFPYYLAVLDPSSADSERQQASLYARLFLRGDKRNAINRCEQSTLDAWKELAFPFERLDGSGKPHPIALGELLSFDSFNLQWMVREREHLFVREPASTADITDRDREPRSDIASSEPGAETTPKQSSTIIVWGHSLWGEWWGKFLQDEYPHIKTDRVVRRRSRRSWNTPDEFVFVVSRKPLDDVMSDEAFEDMISNPALVWSEYDGVRCLVPCRSVYKALSFRDGAEISRCRRVHPSPQNQPTMVYPFEVHEKSHKLDNLSEYIRWTADNSDASFAEVAEATWRFIQDVDAILAKKHPEARAYDLERASRIIEELQKTPAT